MKPKKDIKISKNTIFTIIVLTLITIFSVAVTPITLQNDTYYTVKVGEHITQYGVDMRNHFHGMRD